MMQYNIEEPAPVDWRPIIRAAEVLRIQAGTIQQLNNGKWTTALQHAIDIANQLEAIATVLCNSEEV